MLPALFRKSAVTERSTFSRALERFRKNRALAREERALEEQRRWEEILSSRAKQDEVSVRARCAVTGRYYRTLYRRAPEDGKFVPVAQFKEESRRADPAQQHTGANDATIAAKEFRHWSRMPCPWCKKRFVHTQIRCDRCNQYVCTGRGYVDSDGTLMHLCHEDCGRHAPVSRARDTVQVERNAPGTGSGKALVKQGNEARSLVAQVERPIKLWP